MNREELAWAAGFFDGEGYIGATKGRKGRRQLQLIAPQIDRRVLDRFQAVVGIGKVFGPYAHRRLERNQQPRFEYHANHYERVQAVIALLWHWLSPVKREQAATALRVSRADCLAAPGKPHERSVCKHGHAFTEKNTHRSVGREGYVYRRCRKCSCQRMQELRDRRRLAIALIGAA